MKKIDEKYFIPPSDPKKQDLPLDSVLTAGEEILWRGKPLRRSFLLSSFFKFFFVALLWGLFDGFAIAMIVTHIPELPIPLIIFMIVFFLFHLLPLWLWIYNIISAGRRQKLEEYAFTGTRIIIKRGFVGAEIQSIYYSSITSVNLRIGIIEKLCKVGDIYIVADTQRNVLEDIQDPYFIYGRLQKIANDIKSDILYPNAKRPGTNPGYKTSYKPSENEKGIH